MTIVTMTREREVLIRATMMMVRAREVVLVSVAFMWHVTAREGEVRVTIMMKKLCHSPFILCTPQVHGIVLQQR
jgi:hypothetical protein